MAYSGISGVEFCSLRERRGFWNEFNAGQPIWSRRPKIKLRRRTKALWIDYSAEKRRVRRDRTETYKLLTKTDNILLAL